MVPNTLHPCANPAGQGTGEPNGAVPLVCRRLHPFLLLFHPAVHLQSLAGWLAGPSRGACSHCGAHPLCHRGERASGAPAAVAAVMPALLGLPAALDALPGALGPRGFLDAGSLLLLLQVLSSENG